jgi:SNF2 family DNA or RNA helicase
MAPRKKSPAASKKKAPAKKASASRRGKKAVPRKQASKKSGAKKKPAAKRASSKSSKRTTAGAKKQAKKASSTRSATPRSRQEQPALAALLEKEPTPTQRRPAKRKTIPEGIPTEEHLWLLNVPFDDRTDAKWAGARWDATRRKWVHRGAELPARLARWAATPHSWERWLQEDINKTRLPAAETAGIQLRAHQLEAAAGIKHAFSNGLPGFLLADQVGLGKTYSTIKGVNDIGTGLNILVLCPLSVSHHWRRSIDAMGDGGNRWCVQNYDRAKQLLTEPESAKSAVRARTKNKRIAQQGRSVVAWDIIIADEAHRLKNPQSQRSAAVRQLAKAHGSDAFMVWLSATAGQNPLELAYLAPVLSWRTGASARDMNDFEAWCREMGLGVKRGGFGSWVWERNEGDLQMMRRLLFDGGLPAGMRRRPEDLEGWPEIQRILWPVELGWAESTLYNEAWEEFRAQMGLAPAGSSSHNALVAALRFRQKASLLRVEQTARHAAELAEAGLQVAISAQFIETIEALATALEAHGLECARITGRESADAREADRIAFQQGHKQVCLFTVTEGISLHAGEQAVQATSNERALLVHDLRWSALEMAQIEGRCHRDGQNAVAYYLYADGTVEHKVAVAVLGRLADMGTMLGDDTVGLDAMLAEVRPAT